MWVRPSERGHANLLACLSLRLVDPIQAVDPLKGILTVDMLVPQRPITVRFTIAHYVPDRGLPYPRWPSLDESDRRVLHHRSLDLAQMAL
jgi:hypothetical protein